MLSVWDPFADLSRFQREFEKSFSQGRARPASFAPSVDVQEEEDALVLRADLPGVKREDIDIQVDGNVLTLKGERKLETASEQRRYHRVERSHGSFVRQWQLPTNVEASKVDASFENGVLTLKLPKKEEQKARKIEIRGN
ncbi:MAG: Hsp20/alpha crystallin family protein [Polyangiales bacterium]